MKSEKDKEIDKISNNVPKENILDSLENNVTSKLNSLEKNVSYNLDYLENSVTSHLDSLEKNFSNRLDGLGNNLDKINKGLDKAGRNLKIDLVLVSFLAGLVVAYIILAP